MKHLDGWDGKLTTLVYWVGQCRDKVNELVTMHNGQRKRECKMTSRPLDLVDEAFHDGFMANYNNEPCLPALVKFRKRYRMEDK